MKSIAVFLVLTVVAVSGSLESERARLQQAVTDCQKESGNSENEIDNIRQGKITTKTGIQALCVNVKLGHMNSNGDTIADKLKQHVEALTDDPAQQKKLISECRQRHGNTPEEAAINFVKCMQKDLPPK